MPLPAATSPPKWAGPALAGLSGTILISVGASLPGSPFAFKIAGAWYFGVPSANLGQSVAHASGTLLMTELAAGFAGLVLLCRAWLAMTRHAASGAERQPARLAAILALWSAPLLVAPPLFSDDIYSYAAQGELVSHHISPYLYGPGVLGATPFSSLAQGIWVNTPSPYGPLFNGLDGRIVELADHRVLLSVVFLRLLAVAGVMLMAVFVPSLARSYGADPALAFSLGVLNPLVVLFLIGSGHNDALMIGLLVAGLSVARRGHPAWGMVLCALAGAIKVPGLAGVCAIAWTSPTPTGAPWRRALVAVEAVVISAATFEALSTLFDLGWGWIHTIGASDTVTSWITPVDLVAKLAPYVDVSTTSFLAVAHVVGPLLAVAVCAATLRRLRIIGLPRAMGICLMALILLGPIVQPWYLLWGITILAVTAGPRTAAALALLSATVPFLGVVGLGQLGGEWGSLAFLRQVLVLLVVAAAVVVPIDAVAPKGTPAALRRGIWRQPSPEWRLQHA